MNQINHSLLPHHRLRAYGVAVELLAAVRAACIRDRQLRDQAIRAAQSACLNTAEGAANVLRADKGKSYGVARAEAVEAIAATEIAARSGDGRLDALPQVLAKGNELYTPLFAHALNRAH